MTSRVTDTDMGWRNLRDGLGPRAAARVFVGILEDKGGEDHGDLTLAGVAAVNEFGSADGHVPERSFLRSTVDENQVEYLDALEDAHTAMVDGILRGGIAVGVAVLEKELDRLGVKAVGDVQDKIRDLDTPPNAASTIAKKGSSNPLVDTGRLRQSIDHKVELT